MSYLDIAKKAEEELKREAAESIDPNLCWNCGEPWSEFVNRDGERFQVCWGCAKEA